MTHDTGCIPIKNDLAIDIPKNENGCLHKP